jgi:hypothetical protein
MRWRWVWETDEKIGKWDKKIAIYFYARWLCTHKKHFSFLSRHSSAKKKTSHSDWLIVYIFMKEEKITSPLSERGKTPIFITNKKRTHHHIYSMTSWISTLTRVICDGFVWSKIERKKYKQKNYGWKTFFVNFLLIYEEKFSRMEKWERSYQMYRENHLINFMIPTLFDTSFDSLSSEFSVFVDFQLRWWRVKIFQFVWLLASWIMWWNF